MSKKTLAAIVILLIFCGVIVVVGGKKLEQAIIQHPVAKKSPTPKPRSSPPPPLQTPPSTAVLAIHVSGNRLVDGRGRAVQLRGVNRSGAESGCVRGDDRGRLVSIAGPTDANSVAAIKSWHANVVRIPLNESCWLGIGGVSPSVSGAKYRNSIVGYVNRINAAGMYAILDLHWNAPAGLKAVAQQAMADADHSPAFWASVATIFRRNPAVIFDLYNEPYVAPWNAQTNDKWQCWLKGCMENNYSVRSLVPAAGTPWLTAGMQSLVNAVRATGARQPIMLTGQDVGSNFSGFLSHLPKDPAHQLIAQAHIYNNSSCAARTCWQGSLLPVAKKMPLVIGELGEYDCAHGFIDGLMGWSDSVGVSYLAWAWVPWAASPGSCRLIAGLIVDWNGTPTTSYGSGYRAHLRSRG